jgi:site-specific recombinase XerD
VGRKNGVVWHDLRHEYGSFLIDQGATIQEARELMRHADIRTTGRYLKASEDRLRQLAEKFGQRVG